MFAFEDVAHIHSASSFPGRLICDRPVETEVSALGFYFEFTPGCKLNTSCPRELDANYFGVCPGMHDKVVFQLAADAVVDKINAGINVFVLHLLEVGDIGVPSLGITAEKVTALSRELAFPVIVWSELERTSFIAKASDPVGTRSFFLPSWRTKNTMLLCIKNRL